jgi:hypothetical protein
MNSLPNEEYKRQNERQEQEKRRESGSKSLEFREFWIYIQPLYPGLYPFIHVKTQS